MCEGMFVYVLVGWEEVYVSRYVCVRVGGVGGSICVKACLCMCWRGGGGERGSICVRVCLCMCW